jgi:hypothetical protein
VPQIQPPVRADAWAPSSRYPGRHHLGIPERHYLGLTGRLRRKTQRIEAALQGNAKPGKHAADAEHLSEAAKYGGYFVIRDDRVLKRSQGTSPVEIESCFEQALDVARCQSAKSFELRAAMRLARLRCDQGKCIKSRELLTSIYGWFTEGFDTPDLQEAKALLDALG